jgi:hypothetical protein
MIFMHAAFVAAGHDWKLLQRYDEAYTSMVLQEVLYTDVLHGRKSDLETAKLETAKLKWKLWLRKVRILFEEMYQLVRVA